MHVAVSDVVVEVGGVRLLTAATLDAPAGTIVGIVGANGSGKSTLLRTVYRALRPTAGTVRVGGDCVWTMGARAAARRTAVLTQQGPADFDFSVREVVALGRVPHQGLVPRARTGDGSIVEGALVRAGAGDLAERRFATLSGGERQKVLIARALAQEPRILVLDEPTNHLDIATQLDVLELVRSLGLTVLTALHDLNLAAAYCDSIYALQAGRVVAAGAPGDVLTPALLQRLFGVDAHCGVHPLTGRPLLAFAPSTDGAGRLDRGAAAQENACPTA